VKIEKNIKFLPQNERCPKFADYILKIYDSPESKYSPVMDSTTWCRNQENDNWSGILPFTFNAQFYVCHPSIVIFLHWMWFKRPKPQLTLRYGRCRVLLHYVRLTGKMDFVIEQYRQCSTQEVSMSNFIKSNGYKFSTRTCGWT